MELLTMRYAELTEMVSMLSDELEEQKKLVSQSPALNEALRIAIDKLNIVLGIVD